MTGNKKLSQSLRDSQESQNSSHSSSQSSHSSSHSSNHKSIHKKQVGIGEFISPSSQIQSISLISKPKSFSSWILSLIIPSSISSSFASSSNSSTFAQIPILLPFVSLFIIILSHYAYIANHFVSSPLEIQKKLNYDVVFGTLPLSYSHAIATVLTMVSLIIVLLVAYWNVSIRVRLFYKRIHLTNSSGSLFDKLVAMEKMQNEVFVYIVPEKHQGMEEIIPLTKRKLEVQRINTSNTNNTSDNTTNTNNNNNNDYEIYFSYQRRKFKFNNDTLQFEKPTFRNKEKISYYLEYKGLETMREITKYAEDYGLNKLDIPVPTFWELFREHALAPFFVFQVGCVGLWCLDEYWYYSLFTLFMLFAFESTVVKQRQRNMNQVRQMGSKPFRLYVYRRQRWSEMTSDLLVPGDLISLKRYQSESGDGQEIVSPCDVLLRAGKCVTNEALLTGESTPQLKESIEEHDDPEDHLNVKKDKRHIVFGGTSILQHTYTPDEALKHSHPELCPPDGGCVGVVMKTGFETSQGKLVRLILFTAEHVTATNVEALYFILFLLVFAFLASSYVLYKGLQDPNRSKYKLLLNCIMIITSVVPPELPMELSMAVNNSLLTLQKLSIFCTQPFRIPYGGRVTICCFDKTGTLTSDKMRLKYVTLPETHEKIDPHYALPQSKHVLIGCHSLINMDKHIVGDPMESAALEGIGASYNDNIVQLEKTTLVIHKRFAFASELKRMSTVVENKFTGKFYIFCKGAPETIRTMLNSIPPKYDEEVSQFSAEGARVIALAWKEYNPAEGINLRDHSTFKHIQRNDVECNFNFAGFAGFDSGIKNDTLETMRELVESDHKVMMITGDNPLTACHVAIELLFAKKPIFISRAIDGKLDWYCEKKNIQSNIDTFHEDYDYCITGDILEKMELNVNWLNEWIPRVVVFARTTPAQKELILKTLKNLGFGTLMCGDGTNDVGALKQADVGVALLERKQKHPNSKPNPEANQQSTSTPSPQQNIIKEPPKSFSEIWQQAKERAIQAQNQKKSPTSLMESLEEENTIVQLGDASIASPFTSKIGTIRSVYHIIRQGRCTLATTMQMYKILALNCLISAYSLSVLYLDGIKFGDSQMIISGIAVAMAFLFVSRSQPLEKLSKEKPQNSIFNFYFMFSLLGQFFIHILILILTTQAAKVAQPPDEHDKSVETTFKPNLVNSVVFIVTSLQTVVTFTVNYVGHPFMQSLRENRGLLLCLLFLGSICLLAGSNLVPELNESLELLLMPGDIFRNFIVVMLFADIGVCLLWEALCKKLLWSSD